MTFKYFFKETVPSFYIRHEYAVVLFFVLVSQTVLLCVSNGDFLDTDSYTHALRLMDFIQSGSWRETLYMHDNCPFGQVLPYTRITDMFLYVTTLPFLPFMELKQAVLFGGFLYNPVIACLSAVALIWSGRSFFSPLLRATSSLLYFILPDAITLFFAGRPDHHVLLNLLLIVLLGCLLRGAKTQKTAYYKAAGVFGGLAVWATPEGFLSCLLLFAGMVIAWLVKCQNIRQIRLFSQYLFISTAFCLLANPPIQGLLHPDNSRLSVLMVVVFGFSFLSFYMEEFLEKEFGYRSFFKRFFSLSFLALLSFGFTLFLFGGDVIFAPLFPQKLFDIWAVSIAELQPGYEGSLFTSRVSPLLYVLVITAFAFVPASLRMRKLLFITFFPLFLFTVMAFCSRRFGREASVFAIFALPLTIRIFSLKIKISASALFAIKTFFSLLWVGLYCVVLIDLSHAQKNANIQMGPMKDIKEFPLLIPNSAGCLLSTNSQGPELAWETGKSVIGSPYHTNGQGIIDNYVLLNSTDTNEVQTLLKERNIDTILMENVKYYAEKQARAEGKRVLIPVMSTTLPGQLIYDEKKPCFILPFPNLPKKIEEKYLLYHVDFSKCEKPKKPAL